MQAALLPDRSLVRIAGDDAPAFLNGLLTADVSALSPGTATYAALLTPQGKIVVDGLVVAVPEQLGGGFLFDLPAALGATLIERLGFYKLRAKVAIAAADGLGVIALWDGAVPACTEGVLFEDPRLAALGQRLILPRDGAAQAMAELGARAATAEDYDAHRIALGVPRGGVDFAYGNTFPHDADMDLLHGVSFDKGCYVGQEVVSRMHHRGTARTRIVQVRYDAHAPDAGLAVMAGDKSIGTMGSAARGRGLALVRLDRLADAAAARRPFSAGGIALTLDKPAFATFDWPLAGRS